MYQYKTGLNTLRDAFSRVEECCYSFSCIKRAGGGRARARQNNRGIKRGRLWDQRSENVVLFQVS